jgi:hypothetical protein
MKKLVKSQTVHVGFNLPKELNDFVEEQMKVTFKDKTEYFKDLILKEMQNKGISK